MTKEQREELLPLLLMLLERLTREEDALPPSWQQDEDLPTADLIRWDIAYTPTEAAQARARIAVEVGECHRWNKRGRKLSQAAERHSCEGDVESARIIAAAKGKQTGKNAENFITGQYDHAFGVQCVLAGIQYGRRVRP